MSDDLETYEEVRIRGHSVTVVEVREKDKFSEDALIRGIRRNNRLTTPVLPPGTILYSQDGVMQAFLIWRPECELTIEFRRADEPKDDPGLKNFYNICWPCQVYGLKFQGSSLVTAHMWFASGPVKKPHDRLFVATVPNQSGSEMCLGDAYISELGNDLVETARKIIRYIASSRYNYDMLGNIAHTPPEFGDASRWIDGGGNIPDHGPRAFFQAWEDWKKGSVDWRAVNDLNWHSALEVGAALDTIR